MTEIADRRSGSARPASTRSFANAAKWSYIKDGGRQVMTSVITFVLAKSLGPEAFGVAAMALVYVLFMEMLQRQGLAAAVIQRKELFQVHLDSAFWAVLGVSVALTATSIGLAGWWADINDLPQLRNVVIVLSLIVPVGGLVIVQEAVLSRDMDFKALAIRTNLATLVSGTLAVVLALTGAGVWALVAQQISYELVALATVWGLSSWRPRMSFSADALRELLGFSTRSFVSTIASFLGRRGDTLVIGLFFGPTAAGLYYFAARLVNMITDLAARALQGTAFPELSRYQDDTAKFAERATSLIGLSALVSFPLLALLAGGSDDVIALIGTEKWGPASTILRILAGVGAVRSITFMMGPALQAIGRPGVNAILAWINAAVSIGTFASVGYFFRNESLTTQVFALAVSALVSSVVMLIAYAVPVGRLIHVSPRAMGKLVLPTVGASVAGFLVLLGVHELLLDAPVLVRMGIEGAAAVVVMAVLLFRFDSRVREGVDKLRAKKRGRPSADLVSS